MHPKNTESAMPITYDPDYEERAVHHKNEAAHLLEEAGRCFNRAANLRIELAQTAEHAAVSREKRRYYDHEIASMEAQREKVS